MTNPPTWGPAEPGCGVNTDVLPHRGNDESTIIGATGTREFWVGGVEFSEADFPRALLEWKVKQVHVM
jgi:hypothetical protein